MKQPSRPDLKGFAFLLPFFIIGLLALAGLFLREIGVFRSPVVPPACLLQTDVDNIAGKDYSAVFVADYPITHFQETDFADYRGLKTLILTSTPTQGTSLLDTVEYVISQNRGLSYVFLGVSPELTSYQELQNLASAHPRITFDVLLHCPSLDQWEKLTEEEYQTLLEQYRLFLSSPFTSGSASGKNNLSVYDYSFEPWLIANPGNYDADQCWNDSVSRMLLLNAFCDRKNLLTRDNYEEHLQQLAEVTASNQEKIPSYPDLSGKTLIFIGDSVFGNYGDSTSIPGVVNGLTGAQTYNLGIGSTCAADTNDGRLSMNAVVDAFLAGDTSSLPADHQAFTNLSQFLMDAPDKTTINFVINYGLNDYFEGIPISGADPYDTNTYTGAIRCAISKLRQSYPEAQILLDAPNFSANFQNGTVKNSENGGILKDYVDAVCALGEELSLPVLNNYEQLGITSENYNNYLEDDTHPNPNTRFRIGQLIIGQLTK